MANFLDADSYFIVDIILLFILIAFNLQIGVIYGFMIVFDWAIYYFAIDQKQYGLIPTEKNEKNRLANTFISIGLFVGFYFIVAWLSISVFTSTTISTSGSYLNQLGQVIAQTFSSTPILYGSDNVKLVVWGILIPIVETRAFFRTYMQFFTYKVAKVKIPDNLFSISAIWIAGFWGLIFMLFHIVAKGVSDNKALFITFLFGLFSVLCVIYYKEAIQAMFVHILWNTVGTMFQYNIGFAQSLTAGIFMSIVLLVISWAVLFQELPFVGGLRDVV